MQRSAFADVLRGQGMFLTCYPGQLEVRGSREGHRWNSECVHLCRRLHRRGVLRWGREINLIRKVVFKLLIHYKSHFNNSDNEETLLNCSNSTDWTCSKQLTLFHSPWSWCLALCSRKHSWALVPQGPPTQPETTAARRSERNPHIQQPLLNTNTWLKLSVLCSGWTLMER